MNNQNRPLINETPPPPLPRYKMPDGLKTAIKAMDANEKLTPEQKRQKEAVRQKFQH